MCGACCGARESMYFAKLCVRVCLSGCVGTRVRMNHFFFSAARGPVCCASCDRANQQKQRMSRKISDASGLRPCSASCDVAYTGKLVVYVWRVKHERRLLTGNLKDGQRPLVLFLAGAPLPVWSACMFSHMFFALTPTYILMGAMTNGTTCLKQCCRIKDGIWPNAFPRLSMYGICIQSGLLDDKLPVRSTRQ